MSITIVAEIEVVAAMAVVKVRDEDDLQEIIAEAYEYIQEQDRISVLIYRDCSDSCHNT